MTIAPSMLLALRSLRDGGLSPKSKKRFWLLDEGYINADDTLTMRGHNELNNDDNRKDDSHDSSR